MDRLLLACVPFDTPLPGVFDRFRDSTRALVVSGKPGGDFVVTATDIAERMNVAADAGIDLANVRIGDVKAELPLEPIGWPSPLDGMPAAAAATYLADFERKVFGDLFERGYRATRSESWLYSVRRVSEDTAIVVTASERFAGEFRGNTVICRCAGDPVHTFDRRDLKDPSVCNKPHRKPITCSGG